MASLDSLDSFSIYSKGLMVGISYKKHTSIYILQTVSPCIDRLKLIEDFVRTLRGLFTPPQVYWITIHVLSMTTLAQHLPASHEQIIVVNQYVPMCSGCWLDIGYHDDGRVTAGKVRELSDRDDFQYQLSLKRPRSSKSRLSQDRFSGSISHLPRH
ncbi:Uncharacterized protein HZ326_12006 [Fusarium oxysporum f. sp. albedinis]|nr:Uncharacterized protein HZ326_12006 [Fusarium oxysporum f. sp. albedinis]